MPGLAGSGRASKRQRFLIKTLLKLESSENNHSRRVLSLGLSKKGSPRHPLYMPNESFLKPFEQ